MGFFDSIKEGIKEGQERAEKERAEKKARERRQRIEWEKAHPNEDYIKYKILTKEAQNQKPQKLYEPGHKNMVGTVKNMALINMFGTSDLDEVIEKCAPEFTKAMYGVRDKVYEQDDYKAKYYDLKGRTDELEKIYADLKRQNYELLKQNQELPQIVKNK